MKIVSVAAGKLHTYTVALDDESEAAVDKTIWEHSGYAVKMSISEQEWDQLLTLSATYRAREKALYYLSLRDYGSGEMVKKLRQAGIDRTLAEQTVQRLCDSGLIDDARYAAALARDMAQRKLYPSRRIGMALRDKGFANDIIAQVLEALPDTEVQQALELLHKKRYNDLKEEAKRQKALASLARYGFSYAAARQAMMLYEEETE